MCKNVYANQKCEKVLFVKSNRITTARFKDVQTKGKLFKLGVFNKL